MSFTNEMKRELLIHIRVMSGYDMLPRSPELTKSMETIMSPNFKPGDDFKELLVPVKHAIGVSLDTIISVAPVHGLPREDLTQTIIVLTPEGRGYYWNPLPKFKALMPFTKQARDYHKDDDHTVTGDTVPISIDITLK